MAKPKKKVDEVIKEEVSVPEEPVTLPVEPIIPEEEKYIETLIDVTDSELGYQRIKV